MTYNILKKLKRKSQLKKIKKKIHKFYFMNQNDITLAIDVMGGDDAPYKILKGTEIFLKKINNVNIVLFGDKKVIEKSLKDNTTP